LLGGLFPPANAMAHLSSETAASPTLRALHLMRPKRIGRGLRAMSRLIAQRDDWTRSDAFMD
jgi:hypothetical protein